MNKTISLLLIGLIFPVTTYAQTGQEKFVETCSGCHGVDAEGIPGLAPPLHNTKLWTQLGDQRDRYIAGVVTSGLSGKLVSRGETYQSVAMPSQAYLSTPDLVDITHYLMNDVNQLSGGPNAELIDEFKNNPMSHSALLKIRSGGK